MLARIAKCENKRSLVIVFVYNESCPRLQPLAADLTMPNLAWSNHRIAKKCELINAFAESENILQPRIGSIFIYSRDTGRRTGREVGVERIIGRACGATTRQSAYAGRRPPLNLVEPY